MGSGKRARLGYFSRGPEFLVTPLNPEYFPTDTVDEHIYCCQLIATLLDSLRDCELSMSDGKLANTKR